MKGRADVIEVCKKESNKCYISTDNFDISVRKVIKNGRGDDCIYWVETPMHTDYEHREQIAHCNKLYTNKEGSYFIAKGIRLYII